MGIVPGTFNNSTCTRLLLWFASLLSSRLTLMLMPSFSMELYGYGGYAAAPYAYGAYPYAGAYAAGYGVTNAANTVGIAGVAPAALPAVAGGYAGAGRYVANSAGVVHVAKRSADAEPEADAYYGAYGLGYGYGGLYGGYGYRAYGAYPYAYGAYYGKRSADAEPEADAYYGAYGLGYGYGGLYGGYGYRAYGAYPYAYGAYYG